MTVVIDKETGFIKEISIEDIHLATIGGRLEVSVIIDGNSYMVISELHQCPGEGEISHYVTASGIQSVMNKQEKEP